ncbi:MAG TPA: FAD/NAD(P)-binding oxidoreductase, partial [Burkholderiaceae bacterium]
MAHIVVIGAGIGGLPAAFELKAALGNGHRVTVINPTDTFEFVPSNPWLAVGWRARSDITTPIRPALERKGIAFIAQAVTRIDAAENVLEVADGRRVDYDFLVITTGPRLAFEEVAGSGPVDGHTESVCTVDHAERALASYRRFLDKPGPVVVGAMPGASCFGPAYEFAFILSRDLQKRKLRHQVPITFVTPEPYIGHLGLGGVGDSKGMLESELRNRDIKWICNAKATQVDAGRMHVTELDDLGQARRTHELPFEFGMMIPAFKGVAAVADVEGLCNPRGFVLIDAHQRSVKYRNIFAAGVCVA